MTVAPRLPIAIASGRGSPHSPRRNVDSAQYARLGMLIASVHQLRSTVMLKLIYRLTECVYK